MTLLRDAGQVQNRKHCRTVEVPRGVPLPLKSGQGEASMTFLLGSQEPARGRPDRDRFVGGKNSVSGHCAVVAVVARHCPPWTVTRLCSGSEEAGSLACGGRKLERRDRGGLGQDALGESAVAPLGRVSCSSENLYFGGRRGS